MKYATALIFAFISFFILTTSAQAACVFDETQRDSYFQQNVTGTGPINSSTGQPTITQYNNRYYATPEGAQALAQCLGGTVVSTPSGFIGFDAPDTLEVVLPNGQRVNAGNSIYGYLGTAADGSATAYDYWYKTYIQPSSDGVGMSSVTTTGVGNTGLTAPTSVQNTSSYVNSMVSYINNLINTYRQLLANIQGQPVTPSPGGSGTGTGTTPPTGGTTLPGSGSGTALVCNTIPFDLSVDLFLGSWARGDTYRINMQEAIRSLRRNLAAEGLLSSVEPATFDDSVVEAVKKYQEKYASQILASGGLTEGTGYVGASTRAHMNAKYDCTVTAPVCSAVTPVSARYVKISSNSRSWVSWREIEVYDENGSKITPVSASAQYVWNNYPSDGQPHGPELAIDNNPNTAWSAGETAPGCNWFDTFRTNCGVGNQSAWIMVDLGSVKKISKVRLLSSNTPSPATASHRVEISTDGAGFSGFTTFAGGLIDNQWVGTCK